MNFILEFKKIKRTGFLITFIFAGIFVGMIPVINMIFRSEIYVGLSNSPVKILLNANWNIMSMINILLMVVGACIMYNLEYENNAIEKIRSISLKESKIFFSKTIVMVIVSIMVLLIEAIFIFICSLYWFGYSENLYIEILKSFGFSLLLIVPAIFLSFLIASNCKNIWVSLGIGVICTFIATMIQSRNFIFTLFPFSLPFQIFFDSSIGTILNYIIFVLVEVILISVIEIIILRVRRLFR